jgi:ribosomal protein S2
MQIPPIKLTLKQLLTYGADVSYRRRPLDNTIKPYLLGFKQGYNIFDLKQAKYHIRALLNIVILLSSRRQKILLVNHYKEVVDLSNIINIDRCFLVQGH